MKSPKPDPDLAKWCAVLSTAIISPDDVPKGWLTSRQLAEKWNLAWPTARYHLSTAKTKGLVEERKFRIQTSRGPLPVPHYRPK